MKKLSKFFAALLSAVVMLPFFGSFPVFAASGVPINGDTFPDWNFRAYISSTFDKDGNGYLSDDEIFYIWNVHCENMNIYSVKGIEYFPYLKGLWCKGNHISELDLSGNPELAGIWCSFNDFTSLDFSDCPSLEWVYCFNCNLESLNVSNNPKMAYIECNANPNLKELDLSKNDKLENLFCSNCGLTSLDLSNCPLLCELAAFYNDLEYIDVSQNTNLRRLDIWHNERLGNVDVSNLPNLQYYNCAWTNLTEIDVSNNPELVELVASYNKGLKTLDLSHNPKLAFLTVECDINLQELDVSHNPRLYYLLAFGLSSIDTIDISNNSRLCKAYNDGVYVHETENLGYVYSMTVDYGGSGDPFDQLRHCVCFDDRAEIIGTYTGTNDVPDSVLDPNDGHANNEQFVTRAEAMQLLYEKAGSPAVYGESTFTDVPAGSAYSNAIKWGQDHKICFGYPNICSDTFCPNELISRQDFALMAHRYADCLDFGTAADYGRTDWFEDSNDIDFYAWIPFTWAIQWGVLTFNKDTNYCYPRGRLTRSELEAGVTTIFNLDEGASYSKRVGGNYGDPGTNPNPGGGQTPAPGGQTPAPGGQTPAPGGQNPGPGGQNPNPTNPDPARGAGFADFIDRLYRYALLREPEEDGKKFWMDKVMNEGFTGGRCAYGFLVEAPEFLNRDLTNEQFIDTLYQIFFDRAPDEGGKAFWLEQFGKGMTRAQMVNGFIDSAEWCNLCASYGIKSGAPNAKAEKASNNAIKFATRLYTECLGRDYDADGLQFWALRLTNLESSGYEAALGFFTSDEFKQKGIGDDEFIHRLYRTFMGRDEDPDGFAFWKSHLGVDMTREELVKGFAQSQEFTNICNEYGIDKGI